MILEGAGVCPLVKVGDIVEGRTVTDIRCDKNTIVGACRAFRAVALLIFRERPPLSNAVNPGSAVSVNCNECPILANDPDHLSKSKSYWELTKGEITRGDPLTTNYEEPKDIEPVPSKPKHHDRFELIDISEEEQPDGESSSNPNQQ